MTQSDPSRPHVICHMTSSVDGRIKIRRWSRIDVDGLVDKAYEAVHDALDGDAWICGRVTMQGYAMGEAPPPYDGPAIPREDHIAKHDAKGYAIGLDPGGKMNWGTRNDITGDHVVIVLTEQVGDAHLAALRRAGISYIFGGRDMIDIAEVVAALGTSLGIKRLLVEGGGGINGSFLKAGVVNEISLLLAPAVDGLIGVPSVFDYEGEADDLTAKGMALSLTACERKDGGSSGCGTTSNALRLEGAQARIILSQPMASIARTPPPSRRRQGQTPRKTSSSAQIVKAIAPTMPTTRPAVPPGWITTLTIQAAMKIQSGRLGHWPMTIRPVWRSANIHRNARCSGAGLKLSLVGRPVTMR